MSYLAARSKGAPGAPLVMTFHGTGGSEEQFHGLASELIPEAHVVSPRGDVSEGGALRYFRRAAEGVYDMDDLARATEAMATFAAAEKKRTGAERVVGLGYSNGANILAATAMRDASIFGEMILMHPLIPWTPDPVPGLENRRVLVTAGKRDPICPEPQTQDLLDWLGRQGADVTAFWHDGGHEIVQGELGAIESFLAIRTGA